MAGTHDSPNGAASPLGSEACHWSSKDIVEIIQCWMQTSCPTEGASVSIADLLDECDALEAIAGCSASIVDAVKTEGLASPLFYDEGSAVLYLRPLLEHLRLVVEEVMKVQLIPNDMSLLELMDQPLVLKAFARRSSRHMERMEQLQEAVASSEKVALLGNRVVPKIWIPGPRSGAGGAGTGGAVRAPGSFCARDEYPGVSGCAPCLSGDEFSKGETWEIGEPRNSPEWMGMQRRQHRNVEYVQAVATLLEENAPYADEEGWDLARNLLTLNELSPVVVDIFGVDHSGPRVRLRSFEERLVALCELFLAQLCNSMTLATAVSLPAMQSLLQTEGSAADTGSDQPAEILRAAAAKAELLQVVETGNAGDSDLITWRPQGEMLLKPVERVLGERASQAATHMEKEGEVSLALLAEEPSIARVLERAAIYGTKAAVDAIRSALKISEVFELDPAGISCRRRKSCVVSCPPVEAVDEWSDWKWSARTVPRHKDVHQLRQLLQHYFQPFNFQHNRVLMSLLQAKKAWWNGRSVG
ncbi:Serine/threonine-protein phosphatase 2A activator, partial [Durusdinium trenchii]